MKNRCHCSSPFLTWFSAFFLILSLSVVPAAAQPGQGGQGGQGAGGEAAQGGGGEGCGEQEGGGQQAQGGNQDQQGAPGVAQQAQQLTQAIRAGEVPPDADGFATRATAQLNALAEASPNDPEVAAARRAVDEFTAALAEQANENDVTAVDDEVAEKMAGKPSEDSEEKTVSPSEEATAEDRLLAAAAKESSSSLTFSGEFNAVAGGSDQQNRLGPDAGIESDEVSADELVYFASPSDDRGFVPAAQWVSAPRAAASRVNRYGQGHKP